MDSAWIIVFIDSMANFFAFSDKPMLWQQFEIILYTSTAFFSFVFSSKSKINLVAFMPFDSVLMKSALFIFVSGKCFCILLMFFMTLFLSAPLSTKLESNMSPEIPETWGSTIIILLIGYTL